ncbi:MAG: MMPL family transporter [Trueperaceae bacterium]|nr:MMPL family transporter [Trueperaceae bacterium]
MIDRLASLLLARPRAVLLVWTLILAVGAPTAARLSSVLSTDAGFAPGGAAEHVDRVLGDAFASHDRPELLLVSEAPTSAFRGVVDRVADLDQVVAVRDGRNDPLLQELAMQLSVALVEVRDGDDGQVASAVDAVRAAVADRSGDPIYVTGASVVDLDLKRTSERDAFRAELIGLPLSLAVLVVVFGSWVAASLPLIAAVTSITVSFALLFVLGQLVQIAAFAQIIVTMLGLAIGIDYALLLVNRYREELRNDPDTETALRVTLRTAGASVLFSGSTVLLALSALLVPPLGFVRTMGAASMIVLAVGMAVAVTAVPAMLVLLGANVDAGRIGRRAPGTRSTTFWRSWSERVLARPRLWTITGTTFLLLISSATLTMRFGFSGVEGITGTSDTSRAQRLLVDAGLAGLLEPYNVLLDFGERGFFHPSSVRAVSGFAREIRTLDDVDRVLAPTTAGTLPGLFVQQYYATRELAMESPLADVARATVSTAGRYALIRAFPTGAEVSSSLGRTLEQMAQEAGLVAVVGGARVGGQEWTRTLYGNFPWAMALVFVSTFVLLGLAFRSLAIPLKSLVLNTLTVGSAFGVITLVFQHGWAGGLFGVPGGLGFVETSVPIFIFAVVFGLSMDYEVFLISRVAESHRLGRSDREAVGDALASTGGVITSAALIMVVVFSVFLFSSVVLIKTLALGLTVAVLLDATLVRSVLVPSTVVLLGDWNWRIPRWLGRLIDRIGLQHG